MRSAFLILYSSLSGHARELEENRTGVSRDCDETLAPRPRVAALAGTVALLNDLLDRLDDRTTLPCHRATELEETVHAKSADRREVENPHLAERLLLASATPLRRGCAGLPHGAVEEILRQHSLLDAEVDSSRTDADSRGPSAGISWGWMTQGRRLTAVPAEKPTPVTILTGFLGSGKTTLLNNILTQAHGKRIAVIENEYGEVGIDQELVALKKAGSKDDAVTLLANGCLCCTMLGDLVDTLRELSVKHKGKFDHIVIETTGLAAVSPIISTFYSEDTDIHDHVTLDGVVTLVDAKHISRHLDEGKKRRGGASNEALEQIAYADRLVLNKVDLVSPDEALALEARLRTVNSMAEIRHAQQADVAVDYVLGIGGFDLDKIEEQKLEAHDHELSSGLRNTHISDHAHDSQSEGCSECKATVHKPHDHKHDDRVGSMSLEVKGELDTDQFNEWLLSTLQHDHTNLYRWKGIIALKGFRDKFVFQGVHAEFDRKLHESWKAGEEKKSKVVIIGKDLNKTKLRTGLESCLADKEGPTRPRCATSFKDMPPPD